MKIAVCIKMVPNSEQVKIDPISHRLIREDTEMVINPSDMNALTEAISIKEKCGATIDVFTMGIPDAKNILYTALAIGADRAFLVTDRDFAGGDSLGTARVLVKAMRSVDDYDIYLCGALSSDGATGQVGPMIAEIMDIASSTRIKGVEEVTEDSINIVKSYKGKKIFLKLKTPALVTVELGVNNPILPTLRNQMKAKNKEIGIITNAELQMDTKIIGKQGALSIVTDAYERSISGSRSKMIEGDAREVAKQIKSLIESTYEKG